MCLVAYDKQGAVTVYWEFRTKKLGDQVWVPLNPKTPNPKP